MLSSKKNNNENLAAFTHSKCCQDEIKKTDEHEIIVRISEILGVEPNNICKAEKIFNRIKYDIAKYIVTHEYNRYHKMHEGNDSFSLWLEEKASPKAVERLSEIIEKYLK